MPDEVVAAAIDRVAEAGLLSERVRVLWHAGEPLVAGIPFYERAFETVAGRLPEGVKADHTIQSNAMLIDDAWCAFIREHDVDLGISVDGPADLHDAQRVDRRGRGTFAAVRAGIDKLREHGLPIQTITVLNDKNIDSPRRLYEFFLEIGAESCCFNVDEIQGVREHSSLSEASAYDRTRRFFSEFFGLWGADGCPFSVREFTSAMGVIHSFDADAAQARQRSLQSDPYRLISVAMDGSFSTFSPELLDAGSTRYGDFTFGNVLTDSLPNALETQKFKDVYRDIRIGLNLCRETCDYFQVCGGGIPANKVFENETFASAETLYCRLHVQAPFEAAMETMESSLGLTGS